MALGPIITCTTETGAALQLTPFTREEVVEFTEGFEKETITQYLAERPVQTAETEQEWYDGLIRDASSLVWAIRLVEDGKRQIIGNASLMSIEGKTIVQAVNGIVIVDAGQWGRGIASAVQKVLVWYGFRRRGLTRIKAAVVQANPGSRRALEKAGYTLVYTERNDKFIDGGFMHKDCFECLNPDDWAWRLWWGNDRPTRKCIEARARTLSALQWAAMNAELA